MVGGDKIFNKVNKKITSLKQKENAIPCCSRKRTSCCNQVETTTFTKFSQKRFS